MDIWVTLRMTVRAGQFDGLSKFLDANLSRVRGFDGAQSVELFFDEPSRAFLLHEAWQSRDHHQAYLAAIEENGVMAQLMSFMEGAPDVTYYRKLDL
ncbi:MAG: antibiotic biosynthesis monooxygenase [Pseudomonadota bacterium]